MRNEIIKMILNLGLIYNKQLDEHFVSFFMDQFNDLPQDQVLEALKKYPSTKGAKFFPTPYDIRELCGANFVLTEDDEAREIVAKINYAIASYGWTNTNSAKGYIGEVGWQLIESEGGWQKVCENSSSQDRGTRNAQYRELLKVYLKRKKYNDHNLKQISAVGDVTKLIAGFINK